MDVHVDKSLTQWLICGTSTLGLPYVVHVPAAVLVSAPNARSYRGSDIPNNPFNLRKFAALRESGHGASKACYAIADISGMFPARPRGRQGPTPLNERFAHAWENR
jgi:hypothetical protein